MGKDETEIDQDFRAVLAKVLKVKELTDFPQSLTLEQVTTPAIERWRNDG